MTVLSRPDCHLCREVIEDLDRHLSRIESGGGSIEVEEVNIEEDDQLHLEYLERIPVIRIGEETVSEFVFDAEAFDAALQRQQQRSG